MVTHFQDGVRSPEQLVLSVKKALNIQEARVMNEETQFYPREKPDKLTARYLAVDKHSGLVRLQKRQIEPELKVRQKECVPSRFDTRLWLYGLHGRVQSEAFRFK